MECSPSGNDVLSSSGNDGLLPTPVYSKNYVKKSFNNNSKYFYDNNNVKCGCGKTHCSLNREPNGSKKGMTINHDRSSCFSYNLFKNDKSSIINHKTTKHPKTIKQQKITSNNTITHTLRDSEVRNNSPKPVSTLSVNSKVASNPINCKVN